MTKRKSPSKPRVPRPDKGLTSAEISRVHDAEVVPAEDFEDKEAELESGDPDADIEAEIDGGQAPAAPTVAVYPAELPEGIESNLGAVSASDPLRRYLEEVRRYPMLEPEEELKLAVKMHKDGDIEAAKTLVSANLRLVVKIALEYRSIYSNLLDLIQEGNIGLMKAVSKFDPTRGARLGYYASWWIKSYILKYILDNFRLVKIGTTQAQKKLFYHLVREKERLESQGLLAGPKLLAERLDVREKDVVEMEHRLSGRGAEVSIDAPVESSDGEGKTARHLDFFADPSESADVSIERDQLLGVLRDHLPAFEKQLGEREKRLLHDRLLAEDPKTLQEVADLYGLTRERTRQIEAKVIQKLREFLAPYLR